MTTHTPAASPARTRTRKSTPPAPMTALPAALVTPAAIRDTTGPQNRYGRPAEGLYPHISRAKLAEITGYHIASVTGILKGRWRIRLDMAVVMAPAIGITVEELNRDLAAQQVVYKQVAEEKEAERRGRVKAQLRSRRISK